MSGMRDFSDSVGGYWADDNAAFERTNPNGLRRIARSFSPDTALGSAIGEMYTAAGNGDVAGMGLAAFNATPLAGYAKFGKTIAREAAPVVDQGVKGVRRQLAAMAASGAYNDSQAEQLPNTKPARTRPDFTNRYNTQLNPQQEKEYQAWAAANKRTGDVFDYDLRGFWKDGRTFAANGHGTDRYKKPNHTTFSDESMYHGVDGNMGGQWQRSQKGVRYLPSATVMQWQTPQDLRKYFAEKEPGAQVTFMPFNSMTQRGK